MKIVTPKAILLGFIFSCLFLQSCQDDEDVLTIDEPDLVLSDATTELITDWNALWLELDRSTNGMRPNTTARALAYIHLAGYETAVEDMSGFESISGRMDGFNLNANRREDNVDIELALNTAYAEVFDHFMFSISADVRRSITSLRNEKRSTLSADLTESEIENSVAWGDYVARQVIRYSQTDDAAEAQIVDQTPDDYEAPTGAGLWTADEGEVAWFPYWGEVRTFVISPEETSSTAFPLDYSAETGSAYYRAMSDVNNISTRALEEENEDLWIAEFWSDDVEGLMMSPPGRQFSIANQLVQENNLDYEETLELFLKLGFAMNDANVSAWDDKYTYNTERPSTYIQEYINGDFETNLARLVIVPNPSFPSYPSGHATFASAAAGVFIGQFGTDAINFTDRSHEGRVEFRGEARTFSSFTEMAYENAYSRVPLGVHIQADADEGLRLGYEIANAVNGMSLN